MINLEKKFALNQSDPGNSEARYQCTNIRISTMTAALSVSQRPNACNFSIKPIIPSNYESKPVNDKVDRNPRHGARDYRNNNVVIQGNWQKTVERIPGFRWPIRFFPAFRRPTWLDCIARSCAVALCSPDFRLSARLFLP